MAETMSRNTVLDQISCGNVRFRKSWERKQTMKRAPKPDKRALRREAIKEALKSLDSTITTIEFIEEPAPADADGNTWGDVWLYRVGSGQPPEQVSAYVHLDSKRILRLEHSK
jgi:hypothetical protein